MAGDEDSERGVFIPAGVDVRGRRWAVGTLEVIHHPAAVGEAGTPAGQETGGWVIWG